MTSDPAALHRSIDDKTKIWSADGELALSFQAGGDAARYCVTGWSDPEAAETWCVGARSVLVVPAPPMSASYLLALRLRPHVVEGRLATQRLRVLANGSEVGSFTLARRTERACIIPASVIAGRETLEIVFDMPDAARPADLGAARDMRMLSIAVISLRLYPDRLAWPGDDMPVAVDIGAVMRTEQIKLSQLMLQFESLGQNCEFGLVQRQCEAEPLGLLRFASTPLPNLLAALEARFEGMGAPQFVQVEMSSNGREFMVKDTCYGLTYHAWVNAGEMEAAALHGREVRRVPMLVRKLLEDLELGEKIFVFKGMGLLAEEVVFPLAVALRRYGPNRLMFVTLAHGPHMAGTVEARPEGYLVGYLDRFAPSENAHDFLLDQWVAICRAAHRMTQTIRR